MVSSPTNNTKTLVFFRYQVHSKIRKGSPRARALNETGKVRIGHFRPSSRRKSDTAQGRTKVAIDHSYLNEFEVVHALSIGTKINDLGWPWIDFEQPLCALLHYKHVFRSPPQKNWIKIDLYCQQQKCSPGILVLFIISPGSFAWLLRSFFH